MLSSVDKFLRFKLYKDRCKLEVILLFEVLTWLATKIWWLSLNVLSKIGLKWAKEKFRNKIEREIEVDSKGNLSFFTEVSFPAAWLKFKVISKSEVDLYPKHVTAWVIRSSAAIGKISWSKQENIFEKERSSAVTVLTGSTTYHNIVNLPSKENRYFGLYYPLLPNVDYGKHSLGLHGVIEFDCSFGTVVKEFVVGFNISESEWNKALEIWKQSWKTEKTIISFIANLRELTIG